jgi:hypothetical protein
MRKKPNSSLARLASEPAVAGFFTSRVTLCEAITPCGLHRRAAHHVVGTADHDQAQQREGGQQDARRLQRTNRRREHARKDQCFAEIDSINHHSIRH